MARINRVQKRELQKNATVKKWEKNSIQKIYRVALYIRLSAFNGGDKNSDTAKTQELLLRRFIEGKTCFSLFSVYVDNGESGVNFKRDGFERMMEDVREGLVDCIIVKDLSRFGRNYIEVGEYLEKIFPFLGVRFIAVNDGIDTDNPASFDYLSLHLKSLVNEMYARDISAKIGTVLHEKQERGEFIGAWAAYGYQRSEEDKHRLVIDEKTAPVVRDIFTWRLAGFRYGDIVRKLTEREIPSPSQYRYMQGLVHHKRFTKTPWRVETIKWIMENEVYLGHTVQGRRKESLFLGEERKSLPKNKWIVVKNTHEPIVDPLIFSRVQQLNRVKMKEKNNSQVKSKEGNIIN